MPGGVYLLLPVFIPILQFHAVDSPVTRPRRVVVLRGGGGRRRAPPRRPRALRPSPRPPRSVAPRGTRRRARGGVTRGCAGVRVLAAAGHARVRVGNRGARPGRGARVCVGDAPAVRRTVDRALAASIVVGTITMPLGARRSVAQIARRSATPSVIVDVREGRSLASLPCRRRRSPVIGPRPLLSRCLRRSPTRRRRRSGPSSSRPATTCGTSAGAALARATGRDRADLGDDEIAIYWRVVCDANRDTVRQVT